MRNDINSRSTYYYFYFSFAGSDSKVDLLCGELF